MNRLWAQDWQGLAARSRLFRWMVAAGLLFLVTFVGYFARLREPLNRHAEAVQRQLQLQGVLEDGAGKLVELERAQEALEQARMGLQALRWRLAAGEGMSELLDQLALSGHEHGLSFERIEVNEALQAAGYRLQPLDISVHGRYPALRLWLEQWLQQLRLLNVPHLRLALQEEGTGVVGARLLIHAYHPGEELPVPAALADEPAQAAQSKTTFDPFQAWLPATHGKELRHIPLARLEMVGSLSQSGRRQALLRSAGHVYRVGQGDRLGLDEGVVVAIDADRLEVREQIYLGGRWQARSRYLVLVEREQGEVRDEAETMVERRGVDVEHPGGAGSGASG
ncbi:pilus assembly protein PilP [Pseudomonas sp. B21-023]|uniref:pilus assembly protein PilP n=1 Tax=unclassified Pseudomonas TaxID=196821 RepID=UPI0011190AC9|nr:MULTISPECIES: pilus assembly protein PilP [unclassified Pseudomonas]UVL19718.1 pilus assembly protein PilP [Pseudomonas sp. B21-044]UVM17102.1 pilus assembly protein PilP [Pseudomonas sp. B21-023]